MIAWEGPSPVTGAPLVLVITGPSNNRKTGPMYQAWLLLRDVEPFEAIRTGDDEAICGSCTHRGRDLGATASKRTCYVSMFRGPRRIWRSVQAGLYPRPSRDELARLLAGQFIRITAYGDPAFVPFAFWESILRSAAGHAGYTHLWKTCDPRFRTLLMASVESAHEATRAHAMGWRTFRARSASSPLQPDEFQCPASDEAGHRVTCTACQLCRGTSSPAKSVAILLHGKAVAPKANLYGRHDGVRADLDATGYALVEVDAQNPSTNVLLALKQFYRRRRMAVDIRSKKLRNGLHMFWRGDASA